MVVFKNVHDKHPESRFILEGSPGVGSIYIINMMFKYYPDNIKSRYNVTNNDDIVKTLDLIGKKIGAIRNNETDYDKNKLISLELYFSNCFK